MWSTESHGLEASKSGSFQVLADASSQIESSRTQPRRGNFTLPVRIVRLIFRTTLVNALAQREGGFSYISSSNLDLPDVKPLPAIDTSDY